MNAYFIAGLAETLRSWLTGFFGAIASIIPKILYSLCTLIFSIMDILQIMVRKLAGLDQVYYTAADWTSSGNQTGDIAFKFIEDIFLGKTSILTSVFWSFIILGIVMLFITTLIAIFKSEFATDAKSASKGKIVGQSIKAIAYFAIVPVIAFFGIFLANVILQALDSATANASTIAPPDGESWLENGITANGTTTYINYNIYFWSFPTTSTPVSGQIFAASAFKANRIRYYSLFQNNYKNPDVSGTGLISQVTDHEKAAALLDDCFKNAYVLKNQTDIKVNPFKDDYLFPLGGADTFFSNNAVNFKTFDKNNVALVWYYYDLWSFDFIICIGALLLAGKALISLVFGLMKRIFEMLILFIIAAPIASLMPLDNGAALGKWRGKFISKAIGAYAPIVGLNLLFIILPLLSTVRFFNIPVLDNIISVIFLLVGLLMIQDLVGLVAELIGGDNALAAGEGMAGKVGSTLGTIAKVGMGPGALMVKGARFAGKVGKSVAGKASLHRDHRAEEGAILEGMDGDEKNRLSGLSLRNQKKSLRNARLNMTEEERKAALENRDENIAARGEWGSTQLGSRWRQTTAGRGLSKAGGALSGFFSKTGQKIGQFYHDNVSPAERSKRKQQANYERAKATYDEELNRQILDNPYSAGIGLIEPQMEDYKTKYQRGVEKLKGLPGELKGKLEGSRLGGYLKQKRYDREKEAVRYANFNADTIGREGSDERRAYEERAATNKAADKAAGKDNAEDLKSSIKDLATTFKNSFKPVFDSLAGEFQEAFKKESGGIKGLVKLTLGDSEALKKKPDDALVKEQLQLIKAQRKAEETANKTSPKSSTNLSDQSVKDLAKAIADALGGRTP